MKQVNYTSAERVDLPDMAAMQSFAQSEFRRQLRAFVGANFGFIYRGFQVEPEAPATSRVLVKLDNSATSPDYPYSLAIGAENLGSSLDWGQLIGGGDSSATPEGPAQLLLDFALQAVGVYFVELRYASTLGQVENRAFWNEATNTEYEQSVPTRLLPSWELQVVPAPSGGEWIPLATVDWNGSTVDAADITDVRFLVLEGSSPSYGFDFANQLLAFPEFDRDPDRGAYGVGMVSPLAAISALQRQILDIKGQDDLGSFNWYGRTYRPAGGPDNIWLRQTKNLRSLETCTFTIGDEGDYGDFNGENGLNLCLFHIQAQSITIPKRVKIILKNRRSATTGQRQHLINTPVVIDGKQIEIVAEMGTGIGDDPNPSFDSDPLLLDHTTNHGQHLVVFDIPIAAVGITLINSAGRTSLSLKNIVFERVSETFDASYLNVQGPVIAENCSFRGRIGAGAYALTCFTEGMHIKNCFFDGVVNMGGHNSEYLFSSVGGRVENTTFMRTVLRLRSVFDLTTLPALDAIKRVAQKVTFDRCAFHGRCDSVGSAFDFGVDGPDFFGCIDARGTQEITWRNCVLSHSSEENGIRFGKIDTLDTPLIGGDYLIKENRFEVYQDNNHAAGAGVGGAIGSGSHIVLTHAGFVVSSHFDQIQNITIEGNTFWGISNFVLGGGGMSCDMSAIYLEDVSNVRIKKNNFTLGVNPSLVGLNYHVRIEATFSNTNIWVEDNFHGEHFSNLTNTVAIRISGGASVWVNRNRISPFARNNFTASFDIVEAGVILLNLVNWSFINNDLEGWTNNTTPTAARCVIIGGLLATGHVAHNTFRECGGGNISAAVGAIMIGHRFDNNYFQMNANPLRWFAAIDLDPAAFVDATHWVGNSWSYTGATGEAIRMGAGLNFTLTSNWFRNGNVRHTTLAGVPTATGIGYGLAHPAAATNLFQGYL